MTFPDKQGRSAEEAAEYWQKAYWDNMYRRNSGPFIPLDIQLRSLVNMVYNLADSNRRLSLMLEGRVISTGTIIYLKPAYWATGAPDGTISNGRYK